VNDTIAALIGFIAGVTLILALVIYFRVVQLQRYVYLILQCLNIDPTKPPVLSVRVKELARDPARKIEAIKAFREETGAGLAEAKNVIEHYISTLDR
jgi:hypothetical protein